MRSYRKRAISATQPSDRENIRINLFQVVVPLSLLNYFVENLNVNK